MAKSTIFLLVVITLILYKSEGQGIINKSNLIVKSGSYLITQDYTANSSSATDISGNFSITGDWANNSGSTISFTAGTVTFNGSGTQNITGNDLTEFYNLSVSSGASVEVPATKYVTIKHDLTISGNLTLKASSSSIASLIDGAANGGTNTGNLSVEKYFSGGVLQHFVSSPVHNAPVSSIYDAGNGNYHIKWYNESAGGTPTSRWETTWNPLTDGRGYVATYTNNTTKTFTGTLATSSNITIDISKSGTASGDGWNLIGNPYPTPIHTTNFISDNSAIITGTLYFWDDDGTQGSGYSSSDYASINGSGSTSSSDQGNAPGSYIPIGQAFFVEKSATGTSSLTFGNNRRTHVNSSNYTFFIPDPFFIQRFKLAIRNDNHIYNELLIAFHEKGTFEYDNMYDGKKLRGNPNISFYSIGNGLEYVIQSLPPLGTEIISVPLGYFSSTKGEFEISSVKDENIPEDVNIILYDKLSQTETDIRHTNYRFSTESGEFNERFILVFNARSNGIDKIQRMPKVYVRNRYLVIVSPLPQQEFNIQVFDILGHEIYSINQNLSLINEIKLGTLSRGYYVICITNDKYSFRNKVFIK